MAKGEKDDILTRLIEILSCVNKFGGCTGKELARITSVSERTIQRDMQKLEKFLLVEKRDNKWVPVKTFNFTGKVASVMERTFMAAYIDILKDIPPFAESVNKTQKSLSYNFDAFKVITDRPMALSDKDYVMIGELCSYIRNNNKIRLRHKRGATDTDRILSPYRIIYYDGFWYLAGVTEKSKNLIKMRLDFIEDVRPASVNDLKDCSVLYKKDPAVTEYIDSATSVWFRTEEIPVTVELFDEVIDTFEKRQIFNNQAIIYKNSKCFVSFTVADFQDFFNSMARYMPLFEIIEPKEFIKELKEKIKRYV